MIICQIPTFDMAQSFSERDKFRFPEKRGKQLDQVHMIIYMHSYLFPFKTILLKWEHSAYLMNDSWYQASQALSLFVPFANCNMTLNVWSVLDLSHYPLNTSAASKHTASIAHKSKP